MELVGVRILVACEESQATTKELRRLGHEAYSCDIEPCSGGHPEWHLQVDALELLKMKWDMIIAHPPCTYLTNAGAVRMRVNGEIVQERYEKAMLAKEFFMKFINADCERIAVENPTPMKIVGLPPYTQAIQPYQFGHPYSKRTCLWLKGLPQLRPTEIIAHHEPFVNGGAKMRMEITGGFKNVRSVTQRLGLKHSQVLLRLWQSNGQGITDKFL